MHSLLDDAFALVSPTSQGSAPGITLPGGGGGSSGLHHPPGSSPPAAPGSRAWGSSRPLPLSSFTGVSSDGSPILLTACPEPCGGRRASGRGEGQCGRRNTMTLPAVEMEQRHTSLN